MNDDEDDNDSVRQIKNQFPSAPALIQLEELTKKLPGPERTATAWRIVMNVANNPDSHAVLDFARENDFALPCEQTDCTAANLSWLNPLDGSMMIWIPGGKFIYGTKKQTAEVAGFSLGRFPVTNEQFAKFLSETNYAPPDNHPDNDLFLGHWNKGKPTRGYERHPVTWVSCFDALAYAKWAGGTLPTEWLWEKAARGTDGRVYPWGNYPTRTHQAGANTREVGKFSQVRSAYGCEELSGNVSEWCLPTEEGAAVGTFPHPYPTMPMPTDITPVRTTVRGACFLRTSNAAAKCSHRRQLSVARRNRWTGFRLAVLLPIRPVI